MKGRQIPRAAEKAMADIKERRRVLDQFLEDMGYTKASVLNGENRNGEYVYLVTAHKGDQRLMLKLVLRSGGYKGKHLTPVIIEESIITRRYWGR